MTTKSLFIDQLAVNYKFCSTVFIIVKTSLLMWSMSSSLMPLEPLPIREPETALLQKTLPSSLICHPVRCVIICHGV